MVAPFAPGPVDNDAMWKRVVVALVVVVSVGAAGLYARREESPPTRFCTLGIAGGTVNGVVVVYEDQGGPGRDGCDGPEAGRGLGVQRPRVRLQGPRRIRQRGRGHDS